MAGGRMHTPHLTPRPLATQTIKRVWHILVTWHHLFCSFLLNGGVKMGGGDMAQCPPKYALVSTFRPIKVLMVDFQKKGLDKKVFVVHDEARITPRP